jgi:hypothetical protein
VAWLLAQVYLLMSAAEVDTLALSSALIRMGSIVEIVGHRSHAPRYLSYTQLNQTSQRSTVLFTRRLAFSGLTGAYQLPVPAACTETAREILTEARARQFATDHSGWLINVREARAIIEATHRLLL